MGRMAGIGDDRCWNAGNAKLKRMNFTMRAVLPKEEKNGGICLMGSAEGGEGPERGGGSQQRPRMETAQS